MATNPPSNCKACGKPATSKCAGCKSVSYSHAYCSTECQKKDWAKHENICKDLQLESYLLRASVIAHHAYLSFREQTWDMPVNKIEADDDKLVIYRGEDNDKDSFLKFPDHLVKNQRDKNQVFCLWMCGESVAWMHDLIASLLQGDFAHP
jgi:hypothetical protein